VECTWNGETSGVELGNAARLIDTSPDLLSRFTEELIMDMLVALALLAGLATVFALVTGIATMATDGRISDQSSERWMGWRVGLQALTLLFILVALLHAA
jgi:hypothetical protein